MVGGTVAYFNLHQHCALEELLLKRSSSGLVDISSIHSKVIQVAFPYVLNVLGSPWMVSSQLQQRFGNAGHLSLFSSVMY